MFFPYSCRQSSARKAVIESTMDDLDTINSPTMVLNLLSVLKKVPAYDLDTLMREKLLNPLPDKVILMPLRYGILDSSVLDLLQNRLSKLHKHIILHIFNSFAFISLVYFVLSGV